MSSTWVALSLHACEICKFAYLGFAQQRGVAGIKVLLGISSGMDEISQGEGMKGKERQK